jgi:hypothetical protein
MGAGMEAAVTAAKEDTQPPEARHGGNGGTADLMEGTAAAAAAASGPSNFIPELRMAAVTTVRTNTNMEGTARAGRDFSTGRTAAAAAVAVAVAADTEADMPPVTVEERAEEAAEAAGAAGTERPARIFVAKQMAITRCQYYQLSGL